MSAIYYFKAQDHNKRIVNGRVRASSREEVEEKLMAKQLVLVHATTQKTSKSNFFVGGVKKNSLVTATRQLAFLINASVPVVQALDTVKTNTNDIGLKNVLNNIARSIESGKPFSKALKMYPSVFDEVYCNMVASAEEGGSLDIMLNQLAVYIEKSHYIRRKIMSGMMYPGFIITAATLIVVGIIIFLVPKFQEIFGESGRELPFLTQMIINISDVLRNNYLFFLGSIIGAITGLFVFLKTESGKRVGEAFSMAFPLIGDLLRKYYVARFARTLASLLSSGGDMSRSLKIGGRSTGSIFFKEAVFRVVDMVESGYALARAVSKEKVFPGLVKNMIAVGEETGNVSEVLYKIAEFYEDQVDTAVENLLKLIEPILIVGIAFVVGFIVIAMYLPVFEMGNVMTG